MVTAKIPAFREYLASLRPVSQPTTGTDPAALEQCARVTALVIDSLPFTRDKLAAVIRCEPAAVPVIAVAANISQERLRTWLKARFGTTGWVKLAVDRPDELAAELDESLDAVALLQSQAERTWTWADALARGMAPRQRAGSAIEQGRNLQHAVEAAIASVGIPFTTRGRFEGTRGRSAPVDFAIPGQSSPTLVGVAVRGFDSTGSKLSDARRDIEELASMRGPRQFIYAIVDGHGWLRRESDLRGIHALWQAGKIDGMYDRESLDAFTESLRDAARRVELI